ncbi:MAG TPA: glycerol-3-phosphate dehydrogenase/oxidase [Saprospiraceae bacterium]|nr:glycerol-3-phosphate dehydrogenase/oxidase [Saprospiraceae bacterium]
MSFSALDRAQHLDTLFREKWDLLIIGGGITGAGIFLDAVSRGLKTALIEKGDFASGTSSKSTKLIHGGLRYLKNFEIGLVREVGRERAIVHTNARHLVRPEPMLLPIYHDGSIGRITGSIGLWFYDLLADVERTERRKMLSREEALAQEPLLRQEGLLGAGLYSEYRTDDARLTLSIIRTAVDLGGLALNYCEATGFIYGDDMVSGVRCHDILAGNERYITANAVVNATGPWMDAVLGMQNHATSGEKKLLLSKGIHIVIPRSKLPVNQSMYFDAPADGRMIFCIPRDQAVYIGTTDTEYQSHLDALEVQDVEIEYLIQATNHVLEDTTIHKNDVTGSWAGLRALIYEEGKAPAELSRKDEIFISPKGLISIAGGKLTGYRKMAERVIDLILKSQPLTDVPYVECRTQNLRLAGADFDSDLDMQVMSEQLVTEFIMFSQENIAKLFNRYGSETRQILFQAQSEISQSPGDALITSEVTFSIRNEMTHHLADFMLRRTADVFFDQQHLQRHFDAMTAAFTQQLRWDDARLTAETESIRQVLGR